MRARIEDVAAAAGVSIKTVSRVLNAEANVREDTRTRVMEAVVKLKYRPNISARRLAGQRSYEIALAYNNPSLNYLMEVQSGVLGACRERHYNLVLAPPDGDAVAIREDVDALLEHTRPDGVVLIPPLTDEPNVLASLRQRGVPFACLSPRDAAGRIGARMDEVAAVRELIGELVRLGHRRIGHVCGAAGHGARDWRLAGYRAGLEASGIAFDSVLVVDGAFVFESGLAGGHALLALPDPPTAIFAANDDSAAGVLRAAAERGLRVPDDLSVCGFDDTPIARHLCPALTTVRQPSAEMGRIATLQLLERIHDADGGAMIQLAHALVTRESVGPAPTRPAV